jgi:anti-sigma B factor antagonist
MSLKIDRIVEEDRLIIIPTGDIDIVNSKIFKEAIVDVLNENKHVQIDGRYLDYMDSTGLGVLIGLYKTAKENRIQLTLKNLKPNIYKLFDITGLNQVFEIL